MLSCEIIEYFISMMVQNQQDNQHRYHSSAKMLLKNYLKYVQGLGKDRERGAQDILLGQMSLFKDDPNFPTKYLVEIIDDIKTGGKQHQALLEEDHDLMERLISIIQTDPFKQASMFPLSMRVGKNFTESRLISSGKLNVQKIVSDVDVGNEDEVTSFLKLARDNKVSQKSVSMLLNKAFLASQWDVTKLILELTGENKASQESVRLALLWALTDSQWDVVKLILKLTGENKVKQEDVDKILPMAMKAGQGDIIMFILELIGENKAYQKDANDVLIFASNVGQWDIVKRILGLTGENKANQEGVRHALLLAVFRNQSDITKLILELEGDNKANQEAVSEALTVAIMRVDLWDLAKLILKLTEDKASTEAIADALIESFKTFQSDVVKHPLIVPMVIHQKTAMKIVLEKSKIENKLVLCKYIEDVFRYMEIYQEIPGTPLEKAKSLLLNYTEVNPPSLGFFSGDIGRECVVAVKQVVQSIGKDIKDLATLLEKLKEINPHDPIGSLERCIQYIETQHQETATIREGQMPSIAVAKDDEHFTSPAEMNFP